MARVEIAAMTLWMFEQRGDGGDVICARAVILKLKVVSVVLNMKYKDEGICTIWTDRRAWITRKTRSE